MKRILVMTSKQDAYIEFFMDYRYIEFFMDYRYRLDIWKDGLDASHTRYVELIKATTISKELLRKVCISNDIRYFNFVVHKLRVEYYYDTSTSTVTARWYLNKYTS